MAVTPVRALLIAHLETSWNRALLDFGQNGRVAYWVFASLVGLVIVLPASVLFLASGYYVADRLSDPMAVRVLGGALAGVTIIGGSVGRRQVLDWERARSFPVPLGSLFAAELIAGLGDLLPIFFAMVTGALLVGMGMARPALLPLLPAPWLGTMGALLCFRHILGGFTAQILRRLRVALPAIAVALALGGAVMARTGFPRPALMLAVVDALPSTQAIHGLSDALAGRWGMALSRQLYSLALLGLLFMLAARTLEREAEPSSSAAAAPGIREKLWSFTSRAGGVARLHWASVLGSSLGIIGLLMPLLALMWMKSIVASSRAGFVWQVPIALSWVMLTNVALQLNQFGLDGASVKALLVLPIRGVELLEGRVLALASYQGTQILILLGVMATMGMLRPSQALAAVFLSGCQFLLHVGFGALDERGVGPPTATQRLQQQVQEQPGAAPDGHRPGNDGPGCWTVRGRVRVRRTVRSGIARPRHGLVAGSHAPALLAADSSTERATIRPAPGSPGAASRLTRGRRLVFIPPGGRDAARRRRQLTSGVSSRPGCSATMEKQAMKKAEYSVEHVAHAPCQTRSGITLADMCRQRHRGENHQHRVR